MNSSEEEQIYSIALPMVPGIGHIGAKHLIDGMGNAVDAFRLRTAGTGQGTQTGETEI